jgi:putative Holliday junction resolvase
MAREAARFAERIRKEVGLPVELVDERLTSWQAQEALAQAASSQPHFRKRGNLDEVAAAVILREYLSRTAGAS